ncbi:hypothetical protein HYW18_01320 [Candidatus Uhrbacteria bacterium]|nr:hypothetical protein [Candidatus Uhrbacteria bacterium]
MSQRHLDRGVADPASHALSEEEARKEMAGLFKGLEGKERIVTSTDGKTESPRGKSRAKPVARKTAESVQEKADLSPTAPVGPRSEEEEPTRKAPRAKKEEDDLDAPPKRTELKQADEKKERVASFLADYRGVPDVLAQIIYAAANLSASGGMKESHVGQAVLKEAQSMFADSKPGALLSDFPSNTAMMAEMTFAMRELAGVPKDKIQRERVAYQRDVARRVAEKSGGKATMEMPTTKKGAAPKEIKKIESGTQDAQVIPSLEAHIPADRVSPVLPRERVRENEEAERRELESYVIPIEADFLRRELGWEYIPRELYRFNPATPSAFERMGMLLSDFAENRVDERNLEWVLLTLEKEGYSTELKKFFGRNERVSPASYERAPVKKQEAMREAIRETMSAYWKDKLIELNKNRLAPSNIEKRIILGREPKDSLGNEAAKRQRQAEARDLDIPALPDASYIPAQASAKPIVRKGFLRRLLGR